MRAIDRRISRHLNRQTECTVESRRITEAVQRAKEAFFEREAERVLTKAEFIRQQASFIRKRWWVLQAVLLSVMWWILRYAGSSFGTQRCMGIVAPLFVVAVMPELWKNRSSNAMEVECTAFYPLRQIYAVRLLLFAMVDLILVSVFFVAAAYTARLTFWEFVIQFLLPFNVTCCICFCMLYSKWARSEVPAMLLCMVWAAVWVRIVLTEAVYGRISGPVWVLFVMASFLCLGYCIGMGQWRLLSREDYLWN